MDRRPALLGEFGHGFQAFCWVSRFLLGSSGFFCFVLFFFDGGSVTTTSLGGVFVVFLCCVAGDHS